jgi:hypothetical protein
MPTDHGGDCWSRFLATGRLHRSSPCWSLARRSDELEELFRERGGTARGIAFEGNIVY